MRSCYSSFSKYSSLLYWFVTQFQIFLLRSLFFPSTVTSSQTPDGFGPPPFPLPLLVPTLKHCITCGAISLHLHPYFTLILPLWFTRIPWRRKPYVPPKLVIFIPYYTASHPREQYFLYFKFHYVSYAQAGWSGVRIHVGPKYLSPKCPECLSGPTSILFSGCWGLFLGGKAVGV